MSSALYVPDPKKWAYFFQKKPSDILKIDNSTIQLTSPVQGVVDRAKSELDRINSENPAHTIITASASKRYGPKQASKSIRSRKPKRVKSQITKPKNKQQKNNRKNNRK